MANCMTCRHNDKNARYCPLKKAHTDLGYVLNCVAWEPTDEAEMARLRTENKKLWELVRRYGEYTDQDRCEGCVYKSRCNDGYVDECWQLTEIRRLAHELGIEVPE